MSRLLNEHAKHAKLNSVSLSKNIPKESKKKNNKIKQNLQLSAICECSLPSTAMMTFLVVCDSSIFYQPLQLSNSIYGVEYLGHNMDKNN